MTPAYVLDAYALLAFLRDEPGASRVIAYLDNLPIEIAAVDRSLTGRAAHVKAHHSISVADSFAVALAQKEDAPVVTGDPEFRAVEETIQIEWLPQQDPSAYSE